MSQVPTHHARGAPLDEGDRAELKALVVRLGERGVVELFGLTRHTLARALGGLGLYPPTIFMIRQRLAVVASAAGEGAIAPQSNPHT